MPTAPSRVVRAVWNGVVIAESADTVVVEGNHYFPEGDVRGEHLVDSEHTSVCGWKGIARYKSVVAAGATATDAPWYYPDPLPAAEGIAGRLAFWRGVVVVAAT